MGNNGNLGLGPFDESTPCLMIVWMNCQTKLRINNLTAVKSVAILESNANLNFYTWKKPLFICVMEQLQGFVPGKTVTRLNDEAHFWLNGYVNKQNCRIWSEANPQVYVETPLHPEKRTVWCPLWAGGILLQNDEGRNVTVIGDRYRAMLTNFSFLN
ncbi:DUF4817 domain-containing protein [Trichonephila clavipes]|nr:DUF4817 domain-containing protein [Trichonephila clavipes]